MTTELLEGAVEDALEEDESFSFMKRTPWKKLGDALEEARAEEDSFKPGKPFLMTPIRHHDMAQAGAPPFRARSRVLVPEEESKSIALT